MDAVPAALSGPPSEPRLFPEASDYQTPVAVATAFFAAWCWQPDSQPANMNLATAGQWTTPDGWTDLKARAIPDAEWALTVAEGISSACGPIQAVEDGPAGTDTRWIRITTQRADIVDGAIVTQYPLDERWQVLQDHTTGRWLINLKAAAN